jgi:signal transduction histidine kinase
MLTNPVSADANDLPTDSADESADDRDAVRRDLLEVLFGHTPTIVAGNLAVAGTATAVLVSADGHSAVWFWLVAVCALITLRAAFVRRARPRLAGLSGAMLDHTENLYVAIAGATGLAWGVLPWLGYDGRDPFMDFFSVAMLVGMAGGAVTATTALPRALNLYLICALVPFIVKSALVGGISIAGGITIFFYLGVLISFGRNAHASMRNALLLTRQNARLADTLRRERDAVQTAMRAKNLFMAGVTHDLRQPVHAVALHVKYLRSLDAHELHQAAVQEACAGVEASIRAMSSQLSRLTELSRLEAGEARVLRRTFPLMDVLACCAAQFGPVARDKGLTLRIRPSAAVVDSNPMMLQSVVDNLVSNAVRYTDAGRVLLAARTRRHEVELQVWDTDRGHTGRSDRADIHPLPPLRRPPEPARRRPGAVGLALAHRQTELLGHPMTLRSRVGRGSVFSLRLPRM